jgi:hypothetical protein
VLPIICIRARWADENWRLNRTVSCLSPTLDYRIFPFCAITFWFYVPKGMKWF